MIMTQPTSQTDGRVLVTGGGGFLGRHLVATLRARGWSDVITPAHSEYDLVDGAQVRVMLQRVRPVVVVHCAARVGGIGANRAQPAAFFYDNLMMGTQLMHEAWRAGVQKFVALGTVCSYPKFSPIPFRERDLWDGYPEETNAPYGLAKKMQLVQSQAYRQQYGFNSIFLLPVNLYGPGDSFHPENAHVVPDLIRKFVHAKDSGSSAVVLWGDGSPTREFLYVEDAAQGIALATERYNRSDPVNLGSGEEISIRELALLIAEIVGYRGDVRWDTSKPNGQPRRKLDTTIAEREFGFISRTPLRLGLEQTVRWYIEGRAPSQDAKAGLVADRA